MNQQESNNNNNNNNNTNNPHGGMTTAEILDRAMDQCMQRGLFDTASFLGQIALDATETVLRETIPLTSSVVAAVRDPPLTGRAHRHHVVALALMQKGEYLRCHYQLKHALQEYTLETEVGMEEHEGQMKDQPPLHSRKSGRMTSAQQEQEQFVSSLLVPPPQLQFLCLYSLYMGGECIKSTSSNPRKSSNPHLRMLRGMLLTALEQQRSSFVTPSGSLRSTTKSVPHSSSTLGSSGMKNISSYGDPFLCWLHGVVLRELGMKQESATYFLAALCNHPMLWCAWEDLCTLVSRENQIEEIEAMISTLEPRFMPEIFLASVKAALNVAPLSFVQPSSTTVATGSTNTTMHTTNVGVGVGTTTTNTTTNTNINTTDNSRQRSISPSPQPRATHEYLYGQQHQHHQQHHQQQQQQQRRGEGGASPRLVNSWELLLEQFPNNLFLLSSLAGYHYNVKKDLEKAQSFYKRLHEMNPYRLESMDDYSIVLFLRGDRIGLSSLAQQVYHVDPFRAESNYVVGNYYVLMGAHDRGVLHFRRAVAADPTFLAAWTLLGHAYLETKNSAAAVEAYRIAVDLDPRDYRGWYNLGQVYELLQFYHHALYYYWQTTTLRPTDPRMWSAVANCLDREGRTSEAILCLERAEACESSGSDFYPPLVRRLGLHYLSTRKTERAVSYLEKLATCDSKKREDILLAIPHIVPYYLQQAKQLLDVPSRSPSYDPSSHFSSMGGGRSMPTGTGGANVGGNSTNMNTGTNTTNTTTGTSHSGCRSSLADQWIVADIAGRRNIEARWEQAANCLTATEGHLENFAAALGFQTAAAATAAEGGGNKTNEYNNPRGSGMGEEGRNSQTAQLARYYREWKAVRQYLTAQQQQVETTMRMKETRRKE